MRLYQNPDGSWARRQSDAAKGALPVDVPTDHRGLMDFLNSQRAAEAIDRAEFMEEAKPSPITPAAIVERGGAMSLTEVEDFIQAADHIQLARVLDNGVWRLKELAAKVLPGAAAKPWREEETQGRTYEGTSGRPYTGPELGDED